MEEPFGIASVLVILEATDSWAGIPRMSMQYERFGRLTTSAIHLIDIVLMAVYTKYQGLGSNETYSLSTKNNPS